MDVMEGEPAVLVGRVAPPLGGLFSDDDPMLGRGVGRFAPSVSGARGRGVGPDLTEEAESGETTDAR